MAHTAFTTTTRGLHRDTPPMLLFERAKKFGVWNPSDIDFKKDRQDWKKLGKEEKDFLLRLTALFVAGEEAVTLDLLPLLQVIANEGRTEEQLFLTTFLFEEAKHVDFFSRVLREVCDAPADLTQYQSANYKILVYQALPNALGALRTDPSPEAQVRASCLYNMIVEGVLAETGYHGYFTVIDRFKILPGVHDGITRLRMDESRHIAYGVYLLSRLMASDPSLWDEVEMTMNALFTPALGVINEVFSVYDPPPFGITHEEFAAFGAAQFQKRLDRVRKARQQSEQEVASETESYIQAEDA